MSAISTVIIRVGGSSNISTLILRRGPIGPEGPAGPSGGGGSSAYADLTDAATVDLPVVNTPLLNALAGKQPAGTYATGSGSASGTNTGDEVSIDATRPASPASGDLWTNPETGQLFQYYTDANSSQWVEITGTQIIPDLTSSSVLTAIGIPSYANLTAANTALTIGSPYYDTTLAKLQITTA